MSALGQDRSFDPGRPNVRFAPNAAIAQYVACQVRIISASSVLVLLATAIGATIGRNLPDFPPCQCGTRFALIVARSRLILLAKIAHAAFREPIFAMGPSDVKSR